jgi:hypothetical protein
MYFIRLIVNDKPIPRLSVYVLVFHSWWWSNGTTETCCRRVNKWKHDVQLLCLSGFISLLYIQNVFEVFSISFLSLISWELQHCGRQMSRKYCNWTAGLQTVSPVSTMCNLVELSDLFTRKITDVNELK